MAISGYAFKSREHITPYLESSRGQSFQLAQRLCKSLPSRIVVIGYPEHGADGRAYNSGVVVRGEELLYEFRKKHLYVTDESWATEGESFGSCRIPHPSKASKTLSVALGICMDLNPWQFKAPFDAFEFGKHCVTHAADFIIIPMAWTRSETEMAEKDHLYTLRYWLTRLGPVLEQRRKTIVVFANRTGAEDDVVYEGNSCVVLLEDGECTILGKIGREEDLLVVECNLD